MAWVRATGIVLVAFLLTGLGVNRYFYFATYVILQYIVLATAWNILGGYTGYVNFGTPAFFALGAYTAVFLILTFKAPLPVLILSGGLIAGLLGLGIGYLTLRLKGVFFSIATLALAVVLQTMMINWEFVGGAKGINIIRPPTLPFFRNYVEFLFVVMVALAVGAVTIAWWIERSWIGRGLTAIRDNEEAAECMGVIAGRVVRFPRALDGRPLKVPQIGWNRVRQSAKDHPLFAGVPDNTHFYFVNSYYPVPDDPAVAIAASDYGVKFVAALARGNLVATQFHLEKSGTAGLRVLDNFCRLVG